MDRLIGRKKIEELQNSLMVEIFHLQCYCHEKFETREVPNFKVYNEKICKDKFIVSSEYLQLLLLKNKEFADFLIFINKVCPVAKFTLKQASEESSTFLVSFGNIKMIVPFFNEQIEIMELYNSKSKRYQTVPFTPFFNFYELLKAEGVKESIEYSILEFALREQYGIDIELEE